MRLSTETTLRGCGNCEFDLSAVGSDGHLRVK